MGNQASQTFTNNFASSLESLKIRKLKDEYTILSKINQGTYGTVFKVKRMSDGMELAAKCIPLKFEGVNQEYYEKTLVREINFLMNLDSNYILKL